MFVFCFRCAALYEDREDFLHYQNARASRNRRSPGPRIVSSCGRWPVVCYEDTRVPGGKERSWPI
jgi:hypothetical protein